MRSSNNYQWYLMYQLKKSSLTIRNLINGIFFSIISDIIYFLLLILINNYHLPIILETQAFQLTLNDYTISFFICSEQIEWLIEWMANNFKCLNSQFELTKDTKKSIVVSSSPNFDGSSELIDTGTPSDNRTWAEFILGSLI